MPLLFVQLCELLSTLEKYSKHDPPLVPGRLRQKYKDTIKHWFTHHKVSITSPFIDAVVLLSALFPAKRTDRVYNIQPPRLTKLLRRCLGLGSGRWQQLQLWEKPGQGGLSDCVERVLQAAEMPLQSRRNQVTLEQVDTALATVAARCRFSGPKVKDQLLVDIDADISQSLENIYKRLQSREAKWFTRMILKDFSCLDLNETMVYSILDPRLLVAMRMYDDFDAAVTELRSLPASQMADAVQGGWTQQCANDAHLLPPRIGIKLGPPAWMKAKGGVKHAVTAIGGRAMSIERKHDGEYCQIHIDLARGQDCVQIFSKSGKDSTMDRSSVHKAIKDGLRIGGKSCGFSEICILEGELLVWGDRTNEILEFYKLRKHVSRSGSFLGTTLDSQPHPWEHLMIMFYDVMLTDDEPVLHQPYTCRRRLLKKLVTPITGRVDIVQQEYVRFSKPEGPKRLREALAHAFVHRWEGLVLKPSDESYFELSNATRGKYPSRWIKLKKDCIKGLGDTADFAVVGAGYDAAKVAKFPGLNLLWTHFYIGCLRNKDEVLRSNAKPYFFVFDSVSDCMKKEDLQTLNQHGRFRELRADSTQVPEYYDLDIASGISGMSVVFKKPFVFDIAGSGFDKAPNRDIFTLRFPRVLKIHWDRDWKDAVGLDELQKMATEARTVPLGNLENEKAEWIVKLDQIDRGAKGQMTPWDYSQDEDGEDDVYSKKAPTTPSVKPARRARTNAPLLVRMDTQEMSRTEQRLSTGEVVERPSSKHSMASTTNDSSLQTPPTSSPLSRGIDAFQKTAEPSTSSGTSHGKSRKRTADSTEIHETTRTSKKHRPQLAQQSKSEPRPSTASKSPIRKKPLQEVTNSARPPFPARFTEPLQQTRQSSTADLALVPKIPVGADQHFHSRHKKRRIVMEPSSPARETTASESTSAVTTQQTASHTAASAPPLPPPTLTTTAPPLPTPPPTAASPWDIQLPNLQSSAIILVPSLDKKGHPLETLLAAHALPCFPYPTPSSLSHSPFINTKANIILLVESDDEVGVGEHLFQLLHFVPLWHPRTVTMWDWRLLRAMASGAVVEPREFCFARLAWRPEFMEKGAVEVRWCDGRRGLMVQGQVEE